MSTTSSSSTFSTRTASLSQSYTNSLKKEAAQKTLENWEYQAIHALQNNSSFPAIRRSMRKILADPS
ncbi:Schizosaccharomyces specific protein Tam12 [Schizosaccharomyces pombe]|uniref:Uncharacterized protein tam12 n=1 Tax=Schizosaccharomyces pombe (strain 972 / ATCC 24843) TaxID=284812 RepID=TAM12_SCHPO|nr:protein tam12 [Schizosaccharomyces pombe]G2TRR3.1 RecName: Full=Uncharacterized protein tam12; AltName: Full=Transcripts altered in meiosis protein 12 [Schizosaccharomyces pombe 972h-]CCD31380.1 sequence orphan [Schizosaccharomyces pombe]|eukprot:NP_001343170.1 protein tam12 [Schizosaccharomyces pombe]